MFSKDKTTANKAAASARPKAAAPRLPTLWVVPPGGLEDEGFPFGEVLRLEEHT